MTNQKFRAYNSITNSYNGTFIDKIKLEYPSLVKRDDWYVTEKVQGANYTFYADCWHKAEAPYAFIRAAKRTDFIGKDEKFYGHEKVHEALTKCIWELAHHLSKDIVVFGELFGGSYNGVSKGDIVQKEVQYHTHTAFMCFDIAVYNYGNIYTYLPQEDVFKLCKQFNIPHVPVLFKGTLDDCLEFNNEFDTHVPLLYGLDPIAGNICEGVVIKPNLSYYLRNGDRVALKNKNEKFSESKGVSTPVKNPSTISGTLLQLLGRISSGLTDNRMSAIMSKHGEEFEFSNAMKLLFRDSVEEHCKAEYAALSKDEQDKIYKFCAKSLADVVKRKIVIKKAG